ncbi:MAG: hypothetical protein H8E21_01800 [Gammaproteobacteria bacterium]|nr:hypothetical protein [Gammaproteobacteria bacterium]MBL6998855.1 hypothetical protein [Gammaproteobacteria bacterium]
MIWASSGLDTSMRWYDGSWDECSTYSQSRHAGLDPVSSERVAGVVT